MQQPGLASGTRVRAYRGCMTINIGSAEWVPSSCTLPTAARPLRVVAFDRFFIDAVHRTERPAPTRLDLIIEAAAEPHARDLAARETECCSLFTFTFESAAEGSLMRIDVPTAHISILDALEARITGRAR